MLGLPLLFHAWVVIFYSFGFCYRSVGSIVLLCLIKPISVICEVGPSLESMMGPFEAHTILCQGSDSGVSKGVTNVCFRE